MTKVENPSEGGSYVRNAKGALEKKEGTKDAAIAASAEAAVDPASADGDTEKKGN